MEPEPKTDSAGLVKWVCLFVPLVGLVLYLIWKDSRPAAAKEVALWAWMGFTIGVATWLFQRC